MAKELTDIQKKILDFLIEQKISTGIPPSMAEIAQEFGYKTRATVKQHLEALEKKGYIRRNPRLSRGIEIITTEHNFFVSRPVLGEVAAGNPLTIYPGSIDTIELPSIVRLPKDSFLLKVKGESLKDAYIFNGDIIIVNPNINAMDKQIVVAVLDDTAVVKRFYKKDDKIELHSENPEYQMIVIDKSNTNFKIIGVVVGIYRSMDIRN